MATFEVAGGEQFKVELIHPEDVASAQMMLDGSSPRGSRSASSSGVTPASTRRGRGTSTPSSSSSPTSRRVCDGLPSYVEDHTITSETYPAWSAKIVALDPVSAAVEGAGGGHRRAGRPRRRHGRAGGAVRAAGAQGTAHRPDPLRAAGRGDLLPAAGRARRRGDLGPGAGPVDGPFEPAAVLAARRRGCGGPGCRGPRPPAARPRRQGRRRHRRLDRIGRLDDDAAVAHLTTVRGVGPWTAEMFLIFTLGRLDVWPVGDYGVRVGYARALPARRAAERRRSSTRWATAPPVPHAGGLVLLAGRRYGHARLTPRLGQLHKISCGPSQPGR